MNNSGYGLLVAVTLTASGCIDETYKPSIVSNLADDIHISIAANDGTLHEGVIRPCVKMNLGEPDPAARVIEIKIPNQEPIIILGDEILEMAKEQESAGPTAVWVISANGLELYGDRYNVVGCSGDKIR